MELTNLGCSAVMEFCGKCEWPGHCVHCPFAATLHALATGQLDLKKPDAKHPIKNAWRFE